MKACTLFVVTVFLGACGEEKEEGDPGPKEFSVEKLSDDSYWCHPGGAGPLPAVLYNHGGLGDAVGGDLENTCRKLAEAGYLARSEQRPLTTSLAGHLDEVLEGLDSLRADEDADPQRVGMIGFSRGGLLTLQAAIAVPDKAQAVVLYAPASGNGQLETSLEDVSPLMAPVMLRVCENDLIQANHVELAQSIESALLGAGKEVDFDTYPPYGSDGHELFWEVQEPYWSETLTFLEGNL